MNETSDFGREIGEALEDLAAGRVERIGVNILGTRLQNLLDQKPASLFDSRFDLPTPKFRRELGRAPAAHPEPGPASVGFTDTFKRAIKSADKSLKGRILEAIVAIAEQPEAVRGDTVKPLEGDLKGCWRYRIGDHRIVYRPESYPGKVVFLDFGPRGSIYRD